MKKLRALLPLLWAIASLVLAGCATCSPCPSTTRIATRPSAPARRMSPAPHPSDPAPTAAFDRELERRAVMRVVLTEAYGQDWVKRFVLDPTLQGGDSAPGERMTEILRAKGWREELLELPDGRRVMPPGIAGLDVGAPLIADWAAHGAPSPVPQDLDLPLPVEWFTDADWDALEGVVITGEGAYNSPKWQAFHLKHPDSAGVITLSDVGFSPGGDQALIYAASSSGSLAGSGGWILLEKRDGHWTIVQRKRTWVS